MATNQLRPTDGMRAGNVANAPQPTPEKFMGAAEEVPRPRVPSTRTTPAAGAPSPMGPSLGRPSNPIAGAANLMGSGSAPVGLGADNLNRQPPDLDSGMRKAGDKARGLLNGGLGRAVAAGAAIQSIGDSMADDSTDRYAKRFGVAAPTGDGSAGDIAKFVGLRAGGFASDLGNNLTFGLAGKLFQDNPGTPLAQNAAPTSAVKANPAAGAAPQAANGTPDVQSGTPQAKLAGAPLFGAEGVRRIDGPNGVTYTNAKTPEADAAFQASRGGLSIGGGGQEQMASMRRAGELQSQISLMNAGLRDRGDTGAYLRGASQVASLQPGGVNAELQAQIARLANSPNLTAAGMNALNTHQGQQQQAAHNSAELSERGRIADQQAANVAEGQNVAMRGQNMTAATAAQAAAMRQAQAEREYGLKTQEMGLKERELAMKGGEATAKRENEAFAQAQTAQQNVTKQFESMFTTKDSNGKEVVDQGRVAKFSTGVQTFLGARQIELEKAVAAGKASPEDIAGLKAIREKGVAALDKSDLARLHSQMLMMERSEQSAGLFGGNHVQSMNPADFAVTGRKQNLFGSDTLTLKGGGSIREADTRYTEPANRYLPDFFKTESNDLGLAKGKFK